MWTHGVRAHYVTFQQTRRYLGHFKRGTQSELSARGGKKGPTDSHGSWLARCLFDWDPSDLFELLLTFPKSRTRQSDDPKTPVTDSTNVWALLLTNILEQYCRTQFIKTPDNSHRARKAKCVERNRQTYISIVSRSCMRVLCSKSICHKLWKDG